MTIEEVFDAELRHLLGDLETKTADELRAIYETLDNLKVMLSDASIDVYDAVLEREA